MRYTVKNTKNETVLLSTTFGSAKALFPYLDQIKIEIAFDNPNIVKWEGEFYTIFKDR